MKISALRLFNVKRFAGRGVAIEDIGDGVNVLCAVNEFGKSTSFEALHALFFQGHSSVANDVKALRPYSGGSPLVEVDIATDAGRFRITKQYYAGRSARVSDLATGRIVAQADEAENFISALVKDGTAGPAGLLWVRQGITGLDQRKPAEEEREKQVRASLLESVQGEVEAITGGRRMAEIMARTQATLSELVTPTGKAKANGRFEAAIRDRDALAAKATKLGADVQALREYLDRRQNAAKRLAELEREDQTQERQREIRKAQEEFDAAKAQNERLRASEAELRLAKDRRDAADRDLTAFQAAGARAAQLHAHIADADRHRSETVERRTAAAEAIETARRNSDAADRQEREARDLLARLDAALRARDRSERLVELTERLEKAEGTQRDIEACEAQLAHLRLPPKAVDELQALEIEIERMRAVAEAARPTVVVAYTEGAASSVTMDGEAMTGGQPRGYDRKAELVVPSVGTITLRSNRPAVDRDRLDQVEGRHRTLLASIGVPDLAAARERQVRAQRAEDHLAELKGRLSLLTPEGLSKLRESVAAHRPAGEAVCEPDGDPDDVRSALDAAGRRRREAQEAARAAEPLQERADDAFVEARAALATLEAERAQIVAVLGPEAERGERERILTQTYRDGEDRLRDAKAQIEALRADAIDLASIDAKLRRMQSVADAARGQAQELRETIAGLNAEIRARSEEAVEESWRESVEALEAAEGRVAAFESEIAVLKRLSAVLEAARSQAQELYLKPVMAELGPLLRLLFDDVSIVFDERTLLPETIMRNGLEENVERLSGGMREQLSVLTRLAFARLLARNGRSAPVILDDALVYSDDDRIERMFDALHRQSSDQQIIVFSCRQRAFQRLGGNVLKITDWHP